MKDESAADLTAAPNKIRTPARASLNTHEGGKSNRYNSQTKRRSPSMNAEHVFTLVRNRHTVRAYGEGQADELTKLGAKGFQVQFHSHARAILSVDFPAAITELCGVLSEVTIPIEEIIAGGGDRKSTRLNSSH